MISFQWYLIPFNIVLTSRESIWESILSISMPSDCYRMASLASRVKKCPESFFFFCIFREFAALVSELFFILWNRAKNSTLSQLCQEKGIFSKCYLLLLLLILRAIFLCILHTCPRASPMGSAWHCEDFSAAKIHSSQVTLLPLAKTSLPLFIMLSLPFKMSLFLAPFLYPNRYFYPSESLKNNVVLSKSFLDSIWLTSDYLISYPVNFWVYLYILDGIPI